MDDQILKIFNDAQDEFRNYLKNYIGPKSSVELLSTVKAQLEAIIQKAIDAGHFLRERPLFDVVCGEDNTINIVPLNDAATAFVLYLGRPPEERNLPPLFL
jgi:hypothetical protein